LVQLTTATEPFEASSPQPLLNLAAGIILGGILGVAVVLLIERKDPRVREDSDLVQLLGVPILVKISSVKDKKRRYGKSAEPVRALEPSAI
jgi:capsular polysaccharide biosynthesis protein